MLFYSLCYWTQGFVLEDATGLSLNGDLDVHSIFSGSLPTSHPSYAPQRHLEWLTEWRALPLSDGPVELFIGILSAGNHFGERMAVRKSWMSDIRKSSNIVARFFVALVNFKPVISMLFTVPFLHWKHYFIETSFLTEWKKGSKYGVEERGRVLW